jgi:outer membrane receptor protein involved in Fe transport
VLLNSTADSILYDGVLSRVTTSVNADEGYIYGLSGSLTAQVTDNFIISSTLHYTYGRIKTDTVDYPLDHIPPVYGKTSFRLNLNKFRGEFYVMYNGWKRLKDYNLVGEDNISYATEKGMPLGTPSICALHGKSTPDSRYNWLSKIYSTRIIGYLLRESVHQAEISQ